MNMDITIILGHLLYINFIYLSIESYCIFIGIIYDKISCVRITAARTPMPGTATLTCTCTQYLGTKVSMPVDVGTNSHP